MTTPRRVVALESSLDPREFVFHVIAEAREYANLEAYARSLVDVPVEAAPLSRLGAHAETSVRARMKGQPREKVDAAVRRAVGDAVFRYVLFLRLNTSALEMSEREGLRAAATFYWMGCLLSGPREADLQPEEWIAHQAEQAEAWQSWRWVLASILVVSLVEEEAREHLQAHYLGGQSALLTGVQADWDRFAEQVDRLWSIAQSTGLGASAQGESPLPPRASRSGTNGSRSGRACSPTTPGSPRSIGSARTCAR
jgi:hypothetical protein